MIENIRINADKYGKTREHVSLFLILVICLLPRLYTSINAIPVTDIMDEVSMLKIPAFFAGLDWSASTYESAYYGFGYFTLFSFLFKFDLSITVIYRIILCVTSVVSLIVPIISYNICRKHFNLEVASATILSILSSYLNVNPPYNLINEPIIIVLIWVVIGFFCKLIDCKSAAQKRRYSMALSIVLLYSLTIHTRMIVIIISTICVSVFFWFKYRKKLVSHLCWVILLPGYFLVNSLITYVQNLVFAKENITNASVTMLIYSTSIKDYLHSIPGFFVSVLGNLAGSTIFFKGTLFLLLFALVLFTIKNSKTNKETNYAIKVIIIFLFCFICIFITIAGLSFGCMIGVQEAMDELVFGSISFKSVVYLRYYICFASPLIISSLSIYLKDNRVYKKSILPGLTITVLIMLGFVIYIVPNISNTYFGPNFYYVFSWMINEKYPDRLNIFDFIVIISLTLAFLFVFIYTIVKNKYKNTYLVLITILFIIQSVSFPINFPKIISENHVNEIDKILEITESLYDENDELSVYVYDENSRLNYLLQVYLYDKRIYYYLPDEYDTNSVIVSDCDISDIISDNYYEYMLDNNEFLYSSTQIEGIGVVKDGEGSLCFG